MEAYELFAKGRLLNYHTRNKEDLESSIELFEQALFLDPNFAEAYVEIARSNFALRFGLGPDSINKTKELLVIAKENIAKAWNIDPNTASAYLVMGALYDFEQEWEKLKDNYKKALALNPNDAGTHRGYAKYLGGKPIPDQKKSLYHYRIAQRLEPLDERGAASLIESLIKNDKINEAEEMLSKLGYLISLGHKTELEIIVEVLKNKDWTAAINYWEREIEKEPDDLEWCYFYLARAFDKILNDDVNFIKYAKKHMI